MKSARNKTIDISVEEGHEYLDKCLKFVDTDKYYLSLSNILNKTIQANFFHIAEYLPKEFIDLAIIDPPYNLTKNFHGFKFSKQNNSEYLEYTRKYLSLIYPLLKSTGTIYVCCDWQSSLVIGQCLSEFFNVRNRITWQREKGRGSKTNWKNGMEDIYFATKSDKYTFNIDKVKIRKKVIAPYRVEGQPKDWIETKNGNFRDTCPSNFWDDITIPFWSMPENTAHPTQKPEKLIAKLILASSNEDDIIFDPFVGSGTTSVTAKKLNRKYVGIEQNPQYCIWTEKRLELANRDRTIQGFEKGVFFERNML